MGYMSYMAALDLYETLDPGEAASENGRGQMAEETGVTTEYTNDGR